MLNLKEKELFDKKISIINNKRFRDSFIASQVSDINEWDVGLVALWNTPVLYYELKKAYPNKKFYYVETEALKDIYGVDLEDTIYIKEEKELADIMKKFKNPKLIINPPYSIGGKVVAKCKEVCPNAKYSILMPLAQYKSAEVKGHKLYEFINTMKVVGGEGFDAAITKNNCIVTLSDKPNSSKAYLDFMLQSFDQRYIEFYKWNIQNNKGYTWTSVKDPLTLNADTDFIDMSRFVSTNNDSGGAHGYHGKNGCGYSWNVLHKHDKLISSLVKLSFKTLQARENYNQYAYNWTTDKYNCLASKTIYGLNTTSVSSEYYMLVPQIDWDNIHINQKALWDQGLYDEAVLAEMGLKWDGDTIVKETN
jgi:hypothetical protein